MIIPVLFDPLNLEFPLGIWHFPRSSLIFTIPRRGIGKANCTIMTHFYQIGFLKSDFIAENIF